MSEKNTNQNFKKQFYILLDKYNKLNKKLKSSNNEIMELIIDCESLCFDIEDNLEMEKFKQKLIEFIKDLEKRLIPIDKQIESKLEEILKNIWKNTLIQVKTKKETKEIYNQVNILESFRFDYINTLWHTAKTPEQIYLAEFLDGKINSMQNQLLKNN